MNDVALEQLRTLLLAVADVRVLLIKLTDRLQTLRSYKRLPGSRKMQLVEVGPGSRSTLIDLGL